MKLARTETIGDAFKPAPPLLCGTCGKKEAEFSVTIRVQRGLDYTTQKSLYYVDYSVCGDCAREVVEVKLSAKLVARR